MGTIGKRGNGKTASEDTIPFKKTGLLTRVTVHQVEKMLARYFDLRTNLVVPNVSWGFFSEHEADLVVVTKAGYLTEVEIKRSWTDFLADFKKRFYHADPRIAKFYYAVPECMLEPCREFLDKKAQEDPDFFLGRLPGIIVYRTPDDSGFRQIQVVREPSTTNGHKPVKLDKEDISAIARLGTLRYWSLLDKLTEAEKKLNAEGPKGEVAKLQRKINELEFKLLEIKADYKAMTGENWKLCDC